MSILSTLTEDGVGAVFKLIPSGYLFLGGVLILGGFVIYAKIWLHNEIEADAQKIVNAYIVTQQKDASKLDAASANANTKIEIQYVDRVKTIVKVVHDNAGVIQSKVPDVDTILSEGWVSSFNSSVKGIPIDPVAASDKTPSGVTAVDALKVDNANYGVCQQYKERADAWQEWYEAQQALITTQNKKDK